MKVEIVFTVKGYLPQFNDVFDVIDMKKSTLKAAVNQLLQELKFTSDTGGPAVVREIVRANKVGE